MQSYIYRRLLLLIPTLFIVTLIIFFLVRFIPGDVVDTMMVEAEAITGLDLDREGILHELGLDELHALAVGILEIVAVQAIPCAVYPIRYVVKCRPLQSG